MSDQWENFSLFCHQKKRESKREDVCQFAPLSTGDESGEGGQIARIVTWVAQTFFRIFSPIFATIFGVWKFSIEISRKLTY